MKIQWCWRCRMEVPMLENEEARKAYQLYGVGMKNLSGGIEREVRFKEILDYYKEVTGWDETEPNAIMHHFVDIYGPPCENCSKPYRTPKANFCAACGNKRAT